MTKLYHFYLVFKKSLFTRFLLIILALIIIFGIAAHLTEPKTFGTTAEGIWWSIVTIFTVGYGDYVPSSFIGRLLAVILIIVGTGFVSYLAVTFAKSTIDSQKKVEFGFSTFKGTNHIILVGWNERVKDTIHALQKRNPYMKIVVVDSSLEKLDYTKHDVTFIKGKLYEEDVIFRSNLEKASIVLITADPEKGERENDINTIMCVLAAKGVNRNNRCIAEILTKEQISYANQAGADVIIKSNLMCSDFMISSIINIENYKLCNAIISSLTDRDYELIDVDNGINYKTYKDAVECEMNKKTIIIGIYRNKEYMLHPNLETPIEQRDKLIKLINKST
jgi:voltage-gated potassium channel